MKRILLIPFSIFYLSVLAQQNSSGNIQEQYKVHIKKSPQPILIDGEFNEEAWQSVDAATNFWVKWPVDNRKATRKSEVKLLYDDNNLYIAATLYDSTGSHIIQTLKRDTRYFDSDGFGIIIDPVNQHTNGFFFGVSPYNVQAEDQLGGLGSEMNFSWDNKWFSATRRYPDHWTVEIALPFKTLRYEAGNLQWGINFLRNELKLNEYHSWTPMPVNFSGTNLNYTGMLIWDGAPPRPGSNISFIPYITGAGLADRQQNMNAHGKLNGGFDSKIAVTSSLNLDLSVNPDFSQIEVDRQVTNLTRFNIFFPERRNFFLENNDLFSNYGSGGIRPFYSRTIGLDAEGRTIPILAGARLSGNLDKNWRIGLMNMQTEGKNSTPARNYTALSFHRKVMARSSIRGYFFNRQSFMTDEAAKRSPLDQYGRNAGVEMVYSNKKGDWLAWDGFHKSFKPGISGKDLFGNIGFGYFGRKVQLLIDYIDVGTNYHTDMGFSGRLENYDAEKDTSIRLGIKQLTNFLEYNIYPKKGKVSNHSFGLQTNMVLNPNGRLNERVTNLRYFINFKNTSGILLRWDNQDVRLQFPTRFTDGEPLPQGKYLFNQFFGQYRSDWRKEFGFELSVREGKFYNGDFQKYAGSIIWRKQPWGNFSVEFEQNELKFPEPYGKANLLLISPRIEINFSNSIFWTTFLQYNTQGNNFNINSRFQWRYKPMSDIYLVYTDNYYTDPLLKNKNRALVFKMNYWLNL